MRSKYVQKYVLKMCVRQPNANFKLIIYILLLFLSQIYDFLRLLKIFNASFICCYKISRHLYEFSNKNNSFQHKKPCVQAPKQQQIVNILFMPHLLIFSYHSAFTSTSPVVHNNYNNNSWQQQQLTVTIVWHLKFYAPLNFTEVELSQRVLCHECVLAAVAYT